MFRKGLEIHRYFVENAYGKNSNNRSDVLIDSFSGNPRDAQLSNLSRQAHIMAAASGTEPVAMLGKASLVDRLEHHAYALLHHAVGDRRDPKGTRLSLTL